MGRQLSYHVASHTAGLGLQPNDDVGPLEVFTDALGWSRIVGDIPVHVTTAALESPIKCTWNLTVVPEMAVSDVDEDIHSRELIEIETEVERLIAEIDARQ